MELELFAGTGLALTVAYSSLSFNLSLLDIDVGSFRCQCLLYSWPIEEISDMLFNVIEPIQLVPFLCTQDSV